jgi:dihydropteroate synthase
MGIVNATLDSFSDGGETFRAADAIARGRAMIAAGADILDVGGESTRPGAAPVESAEEIARVVPVIQALADDGALISIDTRHAEVMEAAIAAGARIVNDVSALTGPGALDAAARGGVSVVLMHMKGLPETMNDAPRYGDVVSEVFDFLATRVAACEAAGVPRRRMAVDPGFGFGKSPSHNRELLENLARFRDLGCALMVGLSRKFGPGNDPGLRLARSLEAAVTAVRRGAHIVRVHDVADTRAAFAKLAQETETKS